MRIRAALFAAVSVIAVSGCGGSSSPSTTDAAITATTPAEHAAQQQAYAYFEAVKRINEPFSRPPAKLNDFAAATRMLNRAIAQFRALTPPSPLQAAQRRLIHGLQAEVAAGVRLRRAGGDPLARNNAEAANVKGQSETNGALHEITSYVRTCLTDAASC